MSTFTDGPAPSVAPDPDEEPGEPDVGRGTGQPDHGPITSGSVWLHEEIQRRIAAGRAGSVARHARRDTVSSAGSASYVPRHSNPTPPAPGQVPHPADPRPGPNTGQWPPSGPARPAADTSAGPAAGGAGQPARLPHGRTPTWDVRGGQEPATNAFAAPPVRNRPLSGQPWDALGPPNVARIKDFTAGERTDRRSDPAITSISPTPISPAPVEPAPVTPIPIRRTPIRPAEVPPDKTAPDQAARGRTAPARPGPDRTGPDRTGPDRTGLDRTAPTPIRRVPSSAAPPVAAAAAPPAPAPPTAPSSAPPFRPMPAPTPGTPTAAGLPRRHPPAARLAPPPASPRRAAPEPAFAEPAPPSPPAAPAEPVPVPAQRDTEPPTDLATIPAGDGRPAELPGNDLQSRRVRVVLAERKGVARPVRTVVDIQEGTGVGELLRSNLIGSQLAVALRFAIGAGLTLGLLPLLFAMFPELGLIDILGLRLPWLLLGFLVYPFLLGLGWWHTRTAERVEQEFADHVQDN